jgi:hypothetical protein
MTNTTYKITINSNISTAWGALASDEIMEYMKDIKVVSDWEEGCDIVYTHYEADGSITVWQGMKLVWSGVLEVLKPNKQFDIVYKDQSTGLIKESYVFEEVDPSTTNVTFIQTTINQEIADNYKEGNEFVLNSLQKYCESKN